MSEPTRAELIEDRADALARFVGLLVEDLDAGRTPDPSTLELVRLWVSHTKRALGKEETPKPSFPPQPAHMNTLNILAFLHVVEGIRVVVSPSPDMYVGVIVRVMLGEEIFPEAYRAVQREDKDATLRLFTAHINFIERNVSAEQALQFRERIAEASRVPAEAWLLQRAELSHG